MIHEKAYAKVNLGLQVINKRPDSYHNLEMVMASIDYYDELYFENHSQIVVEMDKIVCGLEDNLIYKTAVLMRGKFQVEQGVYIRVKKNIKPGGGLGGGSSDAAATIRGLNKLWNLNLNTGEMESIAINIGSDVVFCLKGDPAIVRGRGEQITPLNIELDYSIVLVCPNYSMSTKEVFSNHKLRQYNADMTIKLIKALELHDVDKIGNRLFNDLEDCVYELSRNKYLTTNKEIKEEIIRCGAVGAVMSGSGSTVIGVTKNNIEGNKVVEGLKKIYPQFEVLLVKMR